MADQPPEYHEVTGSTSAVIPEKGEPSTNYALLSFSWTDKIRLMHFPDLLAARVVDLIREEWTKGVQDVKPLEESLEIKLRGNPFAHGMDEEKIAIRKLLISILAMLAKEGWCLAPVGGLGRIGNYGPHGEKDSLLFQHQQPQDLDIFCVSFDSRDLIHLINAPANLAQSIITAMGDKIKTCNQDLVSGNFEIKFQDSIWWHPTKKGATMSRLVILQMLQCLGENGFKLYSSIELDNGTGGQLYQSSAEVWVCCQQ